MKKLSRDSTDAVKAETAPAVVVRERLFGDIRLLIESAKSHLAQTASTILATLYWNVGKRIKAEILGNERAQYGKEIVSALGRQLTAEYGAGFSEKSLWHMIRFAEVYPDEKIVSALRRELSWTHFKEIIYIDDPLKRDFYAEMCRIERWSTRTLHAKIQGMLYERTALSRKSEKLIKQELAALREEDRMTPDLVFRDPYFLDFLGLSDTYSERDLEAAILHELERFLLELGTDFTFAARQKRITIDREDYYLDLLFYHRSMRRLVAIELKLGKFQAQDKGQMELYLRWLDKYERRDDEGSPLGLILCAEKTAEHVELLQLETSGIRVAEYLTELPPRPLLEAKLHEAIRLAREQIAAREVPRLEGAK
ncbi:hypothetical protein ig2599ANME_0182 [groundwater metagenome]